MIFPRHRNRAVRALTIAPNQPSAILGGDGNQMLFMARPGG
jgi:hypothetical protein